MKKNILLALCLVCFSFVATAQNQMIRENQSLTITPKENPELRHVIDSLNKMLPISVNEHIDMMKFAYEDGQVLMVYAADEEVVNFQQLKENPDLMKQSLSQNIASSSSFRPLVTLLLASKSGLCIMYHSKTSRDCVKVTLSYDELSELANTFANEPANYEALLANQVKVTNLSLPKMLDEITKLEKVSIEGKMVVYDNTVMEDSEFSLADMNGKEKKAFVAILKLTTYSSFKDPLANRFVKLVVATGRGLTYHYVGDKSGKAMDVVFKNKDLKNYLLSL